MTAPHFGRPVRVWTIGDSWLDDIWGPRPELISALHPLGYVVVNESLRYTEAGHRLAKLADPAFLGRVKQELADASLGWGGKLPPPPDLVLLDGGGNDIVDDTDGVRASPLFGMLRQGAATDIAAVDPARLDTFLSAMRGCFERILDVVCRETTAPVAMIAYDHPVPDQRGFVFIGPWLHPIFKAAGFDDLGFNTRVMRRLIDALNDMVHTLAEDQRRMGRRVHALRLAGVLGRQPDFGVPGVDRQYERYWDDELHPSAKGYELLAAEVAAQLAALGIRPA